MTETNVVYVPNTAVNGENITSEIKKLKDEEKSKGINLHVSPDRLDDIKVSVWRRIEKGSPAAMADFVAMFLWDGNSYHSAEDAQKIVDDLSLAELREVTNKLMDSVGKTVAPPQ